jgi:hypothetical protein
MAITKRISTQIKNRKQMSKQTAVEWLEQEFIALQNYSVNELGLFAKAKEMEKKQIIDAYEDGNHSEMRGGKFIKPISETYYKETFKIK